MYVVVDRLNQVLFISSNGLRCVVSTSKGKNRKYIDLPQD